MFTQRDHACRGTGHTAAPGARDSCRHRCVAGRVPSPPCGWLTFVHSSTMKEYRPPDARAALVPGIRAACLTWSPARSPEAMARPPLGDVWAVRHLPRPLSAQAAETQPGSTQHQSCSNDSEQRGTARRTSRLDPWGRSRSCCSLCQAG